MVFLIYHCRTMRNPIVRWIVSSGPDSFVPSLEVDCASPAVGVPALGGIGSMLGFLDLSGVSDARLCLRWWDWRGSECTLSSGARQSNSRERLTLVCRAISLCRQHQYYQCYERKQYSQESRRHGRDHSASTRTTNETKLEIRRRKLQTRRKEREKKRIPHHCYHAVTKGNRRTRSRHTQPRQQPTHRYTCHIDQYCHDRSP